MVAIVPHVLGDAFGFAVCAFGIVVGKDNDVGTQVGYIGEGIADIDPATQAPFGIFYFLTPANGLTKSSGFGDEFVASHEHGQWNVRDGGFDIVIEKGEEVARTPLSGFVHVDVRVRVEGNHNVGLLDEAVGDDAVQVKGGDNGYIAEDIADFSENMSFGINFRFTSHRAVKDHEHPICGCVVANACEQFVHESVEVCVGNWSAGYR